MNLKKVSLILLFVLVVGGVVFAQTAQKDGVRANITNNGSGSSKGEIMFYNSNAQTKTVVFKVSYENPNTKRITTSFPYTITDLTPNTNIRWTAPLMMKIHRFYITDVY